MTICCRLHEELRPPPPVPNSDCHVFANVNIFDGENKDLIKNQDVLIVGNKIARIAPTGALADIPENAIVIQGKEHILMPGLIDVHWHTTFANIALNQLLTSEHGYITIIGANGNKEVLMRGFTTVRDAGGNCFPVKRATDEGELIGPRIYPSGGVLCQTSGHFDFRRRNDTPASASDSEDYYARTNMAILADGVPEVLKRTREQLRIGSTQIKIAAGGGVSSAYDPLDVTEFTVEEIKAAVDCAEAWSTYVLAHVMTDKGIRNCIEGGVKCIEHGFFASKETLQLMKDKGVWLSIQPMFLDEDAITFPPGSDQQAKFEAVCAATDTAMTNAREIGVNVAFGTDVLFDKNLAKKQGKLLTKMKHWFSPHEIMVLATSNNAKLCKMCGPRDPYPGELGVVKEGALADLILTKGNPLENIDIVAHPEENFMVIMKDGKIYKGHMDYVQK